MCDSSIDSTTFTIRIVKNPKPSYLLIGFTRQQLDLNQAAKNSWLIDVFRDQLVEPNKRSKFQCRPIEEGSLITGEKDCSQCALRFFVDQTELKHTNGQVFGWRQTDLSLSDFTALVPCVWLWNVGNDDLIVTIEAEPEGTLSN